MQRRTPLRCQKRGWPKSNRAVFEYAATELHRRAAARRLPAHTDQDTAPPGAKKHFIFAAFPCVPPSEASRAFLRQGVSIGVPIAQCSRPETADIDVPEMFVRPTEEFRWDTAFALRFHCLCLAFPLPSRLRQCLSLRSSVGVIRFVCGQTQTRSFK